MCIQTESNNNASATTQSSSPASSSSSSSRRRANKKMIIFNNKNRAAVAVAAPGGGCVSGMLTRRTSTTTTKTTRTTTATIEDVDYEQQSDDRKRTRKEDDHHNYNAIEHGSTTKYKNNDNNNKNNHYAKVRAILFMAAASAIHFAGYELARSGTMALFTSSTIGFQSPSASPISTICMMPFSLLLLWVYTKTLGMWGPRISLFLSALAFAIMVASGAWIIDMIQANLLSMTIGQLRDDDDCDIDQQQQNQQWSSQILVWKRLAQGTIFALNVAEGAFVQLLYTQHWSFLGSIAKDWAGATVWFAPIAGLGSIASTIAALSVEPLMTNYGLTGLLWTASIFLLVSSIASDTAYRIAIQHQFEPSRNQGPTTSSASSTQKSASSSMPSHTALIDTSVQLFARVPALASLCVEVLACQSVSSIINFLFILKVKECIPNDQHRAAWTGLCYAWINGLSGFLQFCVIPFWIGKDSSSSQSSTKGEPQFSSSLQQQQPQPQHHQSLWLLMPLTMMVSATFMIYESEHLTLLLVTASFSIYKVLEYSVRGVVVEMLYMSLDYESRFVGKEVIGLFVDRLGKSSTAIILTVVTNVFDQSPQLDKVFVQALSVSSLMWLFASYPLAQHNGHSKVKVQ
jgi:ATP/ADP translocase